MAELIPGQTMVLTWTTSTGTTSLAGDYRTCEFNPSIAYEDVTAGADTQIGRLPTIKDATASVAVVAQTAGTALIAQLATGQAGTLTIQPEGTATGKRKITLPAYSDGVKQPFTYASVSVYTCGFTGSSVLGNYTDATN
jgi:hypothetical protein